MNKKVKIPHIHPVFPHIHTVALRVHPVVFRAVLILLMTAVFSAIVFETIHSEHEIECNEDNCAICLVLQIIHNTQKTSALAQVASSEYISFFYINILILSAVLLIPATLVKQKIKLVI